MRDGSEPQLIAQRATLPRDLGEVYDLAHIVERVGVIVVYEASIPMSRDDAQM